MKKDDKKPSLLVELTKRKMEAQMSGATAESLRKFQPSKVRYDKKSPIGPSRNRRKSN